MKIDTNADILPGKSLGGIQLRTRLVDIQKDLMDYRSKMNFKKFYSLVSIFEARYTVADGAIDICVDVRNGKVFKICANEGYTGKLFGKLQVGMIVQDAMSIEPRLYYDEAEEVLQINGVEGVTLDVPVDDPFPYEVPPMPISAICVEIPEILSSAVQRGNW